MKKNLRTGLALLNNRWRYRVFYGVRGVEGTPWHDNEPMESLVQWKKEGRLPKKGRALDVGCGGGTNTLWLAQQGYETTGLDLTPKAIEFARGKAKSERAKIAWVTGDVLKADLNGGFDVIVDRGCYHSLPEQARVDYAERLKSWLRPGGAFVLGCFVWGGISERVTPFPAPRVPEGEPVRLFVPPFSLVDRDELRDRIGAVRSRFAIHLFSR